MFHWELLFALSGWLGGVGGFGFAGRSRTTRLGLADFEYSRRGLGGLGALGRGVLRNFPFALGLDGLFYDFHAGEDLRQPLAGIELIQQRVPDDDAMHTHALQPLDLLEGADARFQDAETSALGDLFHQGERLLPPGLPGIKVPAQHTHDIGVGIEGPLEVGLAGHLHDHVQVLGPGQLLEGHEALGLQQGRHEEHGVSPEDLAFLDLVLLEDEIVAEQGDLHRGADIAEVLVLAEEQEAVGGHRDGPRSVLHQALGVGGGPVGLPHLTPEGVAASGFGDDRDPRLAQLFLERVVPLVGILDGRGSLLLLDFDVQCLEYLDFFQHLKPPSPIGS